MHSQYPGDRPDRPRPPVTYSRHSTSAHSPHGLGATTNNVDNEAMGEAAFDRISRGARETHSGTARYRAAARAVTKAPKPRRTAEAQSRPGALFSPSARSGKGKEKTDASYRPETRSFIKEEDDDIAEAIARSLNDTVGGSGVAGPLPSIPGEQDDSDITEAQIMSLLSNDKPAKHTAEGHSYQSIGSDAASTSIMPYTALLSIRDAMRISVKAAEAMSPEKLATSGPELAHVMRTWHNTVSRIIWAAEAAEHKRIEDIQAQLDYDQVVENKHKRKMLQMEQDYKKELDKQKQAYESLLAQQVAKPSTAPAVQPRTVKSPSPHLQGEIDRLTNEITALKSQNKAKVSNMEAVHADRVAVLSEKVDRLAAANALLRKPDNSEKEMMKQMYEAQLQELTRDRDNLAKTIEGLKKKLPPVQPFIFSAGGGSVSGRSTRSAPSPSPRSPASQEGSEGWSRKRARRM